jgi:hypothetical protein
VCNFFVIFFLKKKSQNYEYQEEEKKLCLNGLNNKIKILKKMMLG